MAATKKAAAKTVAAKEGKEKVNKAEAKPVEVKAETEAAAPVKTAKAEAPKKETKPAAKKAPAKEPKAKVVFQFAGKEVVAKDLLKEAIKAYTKAHKDVTVKTIDLYVVAEEHAAYYVVNGEADPEFKVML